MFSRTLLLPYEENCKQVNYKYLHVKIIPKVCKKNYYIPFYQVYHAHTEQNHQIAPLKEVLFTLFKRRTFLTNFNWKSTLQMKILLRITKRNGLKPFCKVSLRYTHSRLLNKIQVSFN